MTALDAAIARLDANLKELYARRDELRQADAEMAIGSSVLYRA